MAEAEYEVNTPKIFLIGLLSLILTAAAIVGLQALYYWQETGAETAMEHDDPPAKLEALLETQRGRLMDYRVVDAEKRIVGVPIRRAMELAVTELSQPEARKTDPAEVLPKENHDET